MDDPEPIEFVFTFSIILILLITLAAVIGFYLIMGISYFLYIFYFAN